MSNKKKYLVKLKPIGFWFFGSERNMGFGRDNVRVPYFVHSKLYPSQTTLLGGMRFLLQKQLVGLNDDFSINTELIGKESFNIENDSQSFGIIKKVGPVFVMDSNQNIYIPCPLNLKHEEKSQADGSPTRYYVPYSLKEYNLGFEVDKYVFDGFRVKEYNPSEKFLKLPPMDVNAHNMEKTKNNIDIEVVQQDFIFVGKNKNRTNKSLKEDSFFKQKMFTFKSDYKSEDEDLKMDKAKTMGPDGRDFCFAFELELDGEGCTLEVKLRNKLQNQELEEDILMLGSSKSTFKVTFEEIKEKQEDAYSLEKRIRLALERNDYFVKELSDAHLYYVASDTYLDKEIKQQIFSVKRTEFFRNLETRYGQNAMLNKFKHIYGANRIKTIITAGSVIYVKGESTPADSEEKNKHLQMIGMNSLIKISKEK